jgi:hypothetical protein
MQVDVQPGSKGLPNAGPLLDNSSRHRTGRTPFHVAAGFLGLIAGWFLLYGVWAHWPYLSSGSDLVFHAKIRAEKNASIFGELQSGQKKVLIFGTSKILAGFVSHQFDKSAADAGMSIRSFNSGYPARDFFVPQLKMMTGRGTVPDVLLLTEAWSRDAGPDVFHPIRDDHLLADTMFPFRHLIRDGMSFILNARQHGGMANYYQLSRLNVEQMMRDNGYYFIAEQSHYPHDRLPANFSEPTDNPTHVAGRVANAQSHEGAELKQIVTLHRIACFYVPTYVRTPAVAPAPASNPVFAAAAQAVGCQVVGPDYFSYPNSYFSDAIHLNKEGAQVFTSDLFKTIRGVLESSLNRNKEAGSALQ